MLEFQGCKTWSEKREYLLSLSPECFPLNIDGIPPPSKTAHGHTIRIRANYGADILKPAYFPIVSPHSAIHPTSTHYMNQKKQQPVGHFTNGAYHLILYVQALCIPLPIVHAMFTQEEALPHLSLHWCHPPSMWLYQFSWIFSAIYMTVSISASLPQNFLYPIKSISQNACLIIQPDNAAKVEIPTFPPKSLVISTSFSL